MRSIQQWNLSNPAYIRELDWLRSRRRLRAKLNFTLLSFSFSGLSWWTSFWYLQNSSNDCWYVDWNAGKFVSHFINTHYKNDFAEWIQRYYASSYVMEGSSISRGPLTKNIMPLALKRLVAFHMWNLIWQKRTKLVVQEWVSDTLK